MQFCLAGVRFSFLFLSLDGSSTDFLGHGRVGAVADDKLKRLKSLIRSFESCAIAYSGGVDSVFLAVIARQVLGDQALAVIADSPSLPRQELKEARSIAESFRFRLHEVKTQEFEQADYVANPVNRCYFCKAELFQHLVPFAESQGLKVIAYGENASDVGDYRPGRQAADQFKIRAPLREVGLTKDEIRALSREMGIPTADKPAMPCLSSRIPYGEEVNVEKLGMIEAGEALIRGRGYSDVRLRLHELKDGYLARIELSEHDLGTFLGRGDLNSMVHSLTELGFRHVTLDLKGYRRGSLNEGLASETREAASELKQA